MVENQNNLSMNQTKLSDLITKENLNTEIYRIELFFRLNDIPANQKVYMALERCSKEILEWWIPLEKKTTSWDNFKELLTEQFIQRYSLNDFIKIVQKRGETLEEFISRIKSNGSKCEASIELQLSNIESGVRTKRVQFLLAIRNIRDMAEILDVAKLLDKEIKGQEERSNSKPSYANSSKNIRKGKCYVCDSSNHYANNCLNKSSKLKQVNNVQELENDK